MKKIILTSLAIICSLVGFSQEEKDSTKVKEKTVLNKFTDNLSGSFESNTQWYNDDKALGDFAETTENKDRNGEEHLRANSYLNIDYNFLKNFTVGMQIESYAPMSLLNYSTLYDDTNIAQYYARYRNNKLRLDITAGYFYEQFGSGLLLRSYEERQLGINNALRGGRIKYSPLESLKLTALYGQQRVGLGEFPKQEVTKGHVFGFDTEFDIASAFKMEKMNSLSIGLSYVGKQEEYKIEDPTDPTDVVPNGFPEMINSFAARLDADFGNVYVNAEYSIKGEDIAVIPAGTPTPAGTPIDDKYFEGNALLLTTGYSKKGFGISNTFRRIDNMAFFSERNYANPNDNIYNLASMNYIPALTKQQDYSLANIYVYNPQSSLNFEGGGPHSGEIGTQLDVFYKFKKESFLGKYKTKVSANVSYMASLNSSSDFNLPSSDPTAPSDPNDYSYDSEFLSFRHKIYKDINAEVRNKWSSNFKSIITYVNVAINKGVAQGGSVHPNDKMIHSDIVIAEGTYKFKNKKSVRLELQHLWTKEDDKNWAGGTLEFNATKKLSIYATDMWNYGGGYEDNLLSDIPKSEHYYNFGGSYTTSYSRGSIRAAMNYGRQRGGLFCVGGVCRQVSPNTGLTVNLAMSF